MTDKIRYPAFDGREGVLVHLTPTRAIAELRHVLGMTVQEMGGRLQVAPLMVYKYSTKRVPERNILLRAYELAAEELQKAQTTAKQAVLNEIYVSLQDALRDRVGESKDFHAYVSKGEPRSLEEQFYVDTLLFQMRHQNLEGVKQAWLNTRKSLDRDFHYIVRKINIHRDRRLAKKILETTLNREPVLNEEMRGTIRNSVKHPFTSKVSGRSS